jgi:predicted CoA-binding protein
MLVAVLGASPKRERYSNKAIHKLVAHGHQVVPVNPAHAEIEGLKAVKSLAEIAGPVHTVTVYVGPDNIGPLIDDIVKAKPKRVILNPGAESSELEARLDKVGIPYLEACTLVMLSRNQF